MWSESDVELLAYGKHGSAVSPDFRAVEDDRGGGQVAEALADILRR
jgi:hypothetical protein